MQYSLKWQERPIEKNISGGGVGRGEGYERVERGFRKAHREVALDMELKNQVFWLEPD